MSYRLRASLDSGELLAALTRQRHLSELVLGLLFVSKHIRIRHFTSALVLGAGESSVPQCISQPCRATQICQPAGDAQLTSSSHTKVA